MEKFLNMMKKVNPSFLIHLGDLVNHATIEEHKFFITEIIESGFERPIFLVVGNHDINKNVPEPYALFESLYGPTNFFFRFQDSLFVFCRSTNKESYSDSLNFLEGTLKSEAPHTKYRFVFLHCLPVNFQPGKSIKDDPDAIRLLGLTTQYNVNYVVTGHLHTYHREKVGDCVFITPGSGGSSIRRPYIDPNYNCLEITVGPAQIKETLHSFPPMTSVQEEKIEYYFMTQILPTLKKVADTIRLLG